MRSIREMEAAAGRLAALSPEARAREDAALLDHRRMLGLEPIPTLSLWQAWASLIAAGFKVHETRHWPTKVRGLVAIHASKTVDRDGSPTDLCDFALGPDWARKVPRGCVVALARLTDCIPTEELLGQVTESDLISGNFDPGRFGFRLDNVRPLLSPIPLTGRQGFFSWSPGFGDLEPLLGSPVGHLRQAMRWEARAGV